LLALENLLIDQPWQVIAASSGQEALRILLDYEIFLILLDVQMPEMDGFETAELVRKNRRTMNIPIIFITAIGKEPDFIFKGYESGAVDYLLKPINPEILKKKIAIFYELYQQRQLVNDKNSEMKRMFYIASHDLRSPLVNIYGFSNELSNYCKRIKQIIDKVDLPEDVQKQLHPLLNSEIPKAIDYICSSTKTIDALLKGLLKISRLGEIVLNRQIINLNTIIDSIVDSMQYQIQDKNIQITTEELPTCYADSGLIGQALGNLISNAIKYNKKQEGGFIKISGSKRNYYSVYTVEDNGIGIPDDQKDKIFDLFHRVNPEGMITGEGIGLTAVKVILERNNGKIWVESKPDEGTTFYLALPANKEE